MRIIAFITAAPDMREILAHLGEATLTSARGPGPRPAAVADGGCPPRQA
jgi:hypothetical protein